MSIVPPVEQQSTPQPVEPMPLTKPSTATPKVFDKSPKKVIFLIFAIIIIMTSIGIGFLLYENNKARLFPPNSKTGQSTQELQELANQTKQLMEEDGTALNPNEPGTTATPQGITVPDSPLNVPQTNQPNPPGTEQPNQWQTYQNSTAKFSISYPRRLQAKEAPAGLGVNSIEFRNPANSAVPADYHILIFPKFLGKTIGQDFDKYYAMNDNTTTIITAPDGTGQRLTKLRNRTVGSQRAFDFRATSDPEDPTEQADAGTYIEMGNNVAIISTGEDSRGNLDLMLTTFKML